MTFTLSSKARLTASLIGIVMTLCGGVAKCIASENGADCIRKALEFESQGNQSQRSVSLKQSAEFDGQQELANWMQGLIKVGQKWQKVERIDEPTSSEYSRYLKERAKTKHNAEAQKRLAKWCKTHGLLPEAEAHLLVALNLAPNDAEAQKLLGKRLHTGKWFSAEEWQAALDTRKENDVATKEWIKTLHEQSRMLTNGNPHQRDAAKSFFDTIRDPLSVSVFESAFSFSSPENAELAVRVIANIPHARATQSLVDHATFSEFANVRSLAVEKLKDRALDQVIPLVFDHIRSTSANNKSSNGFLKKYSSTETYASKLAKLPTNALAKEEFESRCFELLTALTSQKFGKDAGHWQAWWAKSNDQFFDYSEPDNYSNSDDYAPPSEKALAAGAVGATAVGSHSCFSADTIVLSKRGSLKISQIVPGDLVTSINAETGELAYKAVIARTIVPPAETRAIGVGNDVILTTLAHPFWVCGKGWVTAKNLKAGDVLRCLTTLQPIKEIKDGKKGLMYNLIVADFSSYFVGTSQMLVHDNSPVRDYGIGAPGLRKVESMAKTEKVAAAK